jgi:hypothetical protein
VGCTVATGLPDGGVAGVRVAVPVGVRVAVRVADDPEGVPVGERPGRCVDCRGVACNVGGAWPGLEGVAVVAGPAAGDVGWRKTGTISMLAPPPVS